MICLIKIRASPATLGLFRLMGGEACSRSLARNILVMENKNIIASTSQLQTFKLLIE